MNPFELNRIECRVRRFPDSVSTDYIIASSRKKETIDTDELKKYVFEDINPGFFYSIKPGDIVVGGTNFGCGSAMEIAVTVLLAAGIRIVIAESFARTFLRNALNNGLIALTTGTGALKEGDKIRLSGMSTGTVKVELADGDALVCDTIPPFMLDILERGGLVPYLKANKRFVD
ncbi:alpha-IPM isomerase [Paralcaligenes ureilyticus]|uniref:3-isopropylmalate/(R)-2-methylmalate dehydratase small subunit n=1 Tax=Paralcaligenes ureilyticus TaxID=627131 RepID=A0A4R3M0Z5_9BURK|nr:alpha-IPM isomerase [Paralcaligenes ureilyticus]TCT06393.1 3-isopropylmalate/(R)-2-methylmalate dehydratase small subunit [Paralcaligenes ureilyticus]